MGCHKLVRVRTTASRHRLTLYSLCAGSIQTYSLYSSRFLEDLHYSQYEVNAVSIVGELALYLTVPFFGYLCDRYSPRPLSLISAFLFGLGYLLAAFTFRAGPPEQGGWPSWVMALAFAAIGSGTLCMYLAAVSTCAKNFANAKYRGLMLAAPIASFGLSGMWESLVGEYLLSERLPDGRKAGVDVFKYFVFLAGLLVGIGIVGVFALNLVGEEEMIEHAVEELERSGLLTESEFFRPRDNYGTLGNDDNDDDSLSDVDSDADLHLTASQFLKRSEEEAQLREKKTWLLNHATRAFLTDRTMWLLAAGFFLVTGPGEAYINNLGTIIPTLTPAKYFDPTDPPAGHASTHVSIIALTSTIARLFTGTMSDLFAPPPTPQNPPSTRMQFSRFLLLLPSAALLLLGFLNLALPFLTPQNPVLFHLSSVFVGLGYGALFSLVPIIISVVWEVENFATNWGVVAMMPAGGAAVWSIIYSIGYSKAASAISKTGLVNLKLREGECQGYDCFAVWAWGCSVSVVIAIVLWTFAWRTWTRRNVVV